MFKLYQIKKHFKSIFLTHVLLGLFFKDFDSPPKLTSTFFQCVLLSFDITGSFAIVKSSHYDCVISDKGLELTL